MKKALLLTILLCVFVGMIVFSQSFVNKVYNFVQWQLPEDWKTYEESFLPGVAYYNGKLGLGNEISEGAVFAVVTQEGFASAIISEMKNDPTTDVQIEAQNYLNGMKRDYYEGVIDDSGQTIWFTLSYFPSSENYSEFMIFAIASGPDLNRDKAVLNHIIASVDIVDQMVQTNDNPDTQGVLTLLNSQNGSYLPSTTIEFEFKVDENLLKSSPWIGIVPSDIPHGDESVNDKHDLTYIYIKSGSDKLSLTAPSKEGLYDLRLHDTDFGGKELGYVTFEVKKEIEVKVDVTPIITTDKKVYKPGEAIIISFKNAPAETTRDWIGLYEKSSDESGYLSWEYLDGNKEGELSFIAPRDEGEYNLRMFDDDSYNTIALSETFNVSQEPITSVNDEKEVIFVSQYQFCTQLSDGKPVDSKQKFSINDERIYIHLTIEKYQKPHTLTWEWIKPNGERFDTVNLALKSAAELGYKTIRDYNVWAWLSTSSLDHSLKGVWKINFYVDEENVFTRQFVLE